MSFACLARAFFRSFSPAGVNSKRSNACPPCRQRLLRPSTAAAPRCRSWKAPWPAGRAAARLCRPDRASPAFGDWGPVCGAPGPAAAEGGLPGRGAFPSRGSRRCRPSGPGGTPPLPPPARECRRRCPYGAVPPPPGSPGPGVAMKPRAALARGGGSGSRGRRQ